ncbi:MAG: hypothetical protein R6U86_11290 [Bacteroidales bacterium]
MQPHAPERMHGPKEGYRLQDFAGDYLQNDMGRNRFTKNPIPQMNLEKVFNDKTNTRLFYTSLINLVVYIIWGVALILKASLLAYLSLALASVNLVLSGYYFRDALQNRQKLADPRRVKRESVFRIAYSLVVIVMSVKVIKLYA